MNKEQRTPCSESARQSSPQPLTSDDVIAAVLPRFESARRRFCADPDTGPREHGACSRGRTALPDFIRASTAQGTSKGWVRCPPNGTPVSLLLAASAVENAATPHATTRGDRSSQVPSPASNGSGSGAKRPSRPNFSAKTPTNGEGSKSKPRRAPVKTARRREQCRNSQARYRNKQREFIVDLEREVQGLRQEVAVLQIQRRSLLDGTSVSQDAWGLLVEYFRLFRHGLDIPMTIPGADDGDTDDTFDCSSTMLDSPEGIVAWIEQAKRYRLCFGDPDLQLRSLEKASNNAMVAHVTAQLTVTKHALHHVFPHLIEEGDNTDGREGTWDPLVSRLVGAQLECRLSMRFDLDEGTGQIARVESTLDMMGPILRLLGNLDDTAKVLSRALISPGSSIGELESLQMPSLVATPLTSTR